MALDGPGIRGHVRKVGFRRVSHGLFLPVGSRLDSDAERVLELRAWPLVLPEGSSFTHLTGAWLNGWWLPDLPDPIPTFVSVPGGSRGPRRPGLLVTRPRHAFQSVDRDGLLVAPAAEILLNCARDLGILDLVPLVESALRAQPGALASIRDLGSSGRPGCPRLRRAVELADVRSESPWESKLRLFHHVAGVPVEPQATIYDDDGRLLAVADLLVIGTTSIHEYDGSAHRGPRQQAVDLRRDRGLAGSPFVRRGFTADDLLNHDLVVLAEIDRAIGRPFRPRRIAPWRRLVAQSSHSAEGRARLQHRWNRTMGLLEWSQTA